jgi:MFS family permease
LTLFLQENVERKKRHLDYIGTLALTGSVVALLFALLQGGTTWAWDSVPSISLFAVAIVLLVLFIWQERRAPEPILPLTLFDNPIITISSIGGVILGVIMFGITSYVPLFAQGVQGGTATSAGLTLGPLLLAWPIAATFSSKIVLRYGYRFTALWGAGLTTLGMVMVMLFSIQTSILFIAVSMVFVGAGLGFSSSAYILSVQNSVPWKLRGVATASTQFVRTMGGTVGVAVMGTILNAQMAQRFVPIFAHSADIASRLPRSISPANVLLTPELRNVLPSAFLRELQVALAQSLFWVYALMLVLAVIALVVMFWLPGGRADQYAYKGDEEEQESVGEPVAHIG